MWSALFSNYTVTEKKWSGRNYVLHPMLEVFVTSQVQTQIASPLARARCGSACKEKEQQLQCDKNEATCVTKAFPVSAVSGHAAPRTTPLLHIHHPAHAVLGDTRTDRHNPASVSKRTPASPSTARTLRNDLCPSASPQQSARGFSTSFPTAADAEQDLCLAPVPGEQARTSVPGKLWMSSKVRQSSPVCAPLGTGAGKPILAKPFPPWNTWISRNGRPDPLLLYKI